MKSVLSSLLLALFAALSAPSAALADGGVCPRPPAQSEVLPPAGHLQHEWRDQCRHELLHLHGRSGTHALLFRYVRRFRIADFARDARRYHQDKPHQSGSAGTGFAVRKNVSDDVVCGDATMTISSVNMHFHGTNTSPKCHSDEVIHHADQF
ncbi:MAG: hypothetical protein WDM89_06550 [Rhizomicrobium sp.]